MAFSGHPGQRKVAEYMLKRGIGVRDARAVCGEVELGDAPLGRACGVDRRVVRAAVERIAADPYLREIFGGIEPVALLSGVAHHIGCTSLVIIPTDSTKPGILSEIAAIIYGAGVSITQAVVDGTGDSARLKIVMDGHLPEGCLMRIRNCDGVGGVVIH